MLQYIGREQHGENLFQEILEFLLPVLEFLLPFLNMAEFEPDAGRAEGVNFLDGLWT